MMASEMQRGRAVGEREGAGEGCAYRGCLASRVTHEIPLFPFYSARLVARNALGYIVLFVSYHVNGLPHTPTARRRVCAVIIGRKCSLLTLTNVAQTHETENG